MDNINNETNQAPMQPQRPMAPQKSTSWVWIAGAIIIVAVILIAL